MGTAAPVQNSSGTIALSTTIANNHITCDDTVKAVSVYLDDSANDGTMSLGVSTNGVKLPKESWLTIWQRAEGFTGEYQLFFASTSGTPNLQYLTWG